MNLSTKQKQTQTLRTDLWLPGGGRREWDGHGIWVLHLEWISNEILLYSTGNYIQSLGIEYDGR